jgi:hypothetical protein
MGYEPASLADVRNDARSSSDEKKAEGVYSYAEIIR